ncbi:MAG: hypothetical protein JO235_20530 [Chroococcidiopsidaceae cyanobacterium CP_BM_RX_35]|nr:hypothetical protein [Chroococcidiopsidaceae cyanobacterium CP_BM_RX_35]
MPSQTKSATCFNYQGVYPCPVCRLGQIQALPLMEAMACDFCHHIFTVNLEKQQLQMPSRQPPLTWHWNGRNWTGAQLEGIELGWAYWLAAAALVLLPTTLIGLTVYAFPPTPDTPLSWVPTVWVWFAFVSHLAIIGWLVIEFYQFPIGAYLRVMRRRLLRR